MEKSPINFDIIANHRGLNYFDKRDTENLKNTINIDPTTGVLINTTEGLQTASLEAVLAHEMGHSTGTKDDGPDHMNNVNQNENPIRKELGEPLRTTYDGQDESSTPPVKPQPRID